jgi:hypothetical protein
MTLQSFVKCLELPHGRCPFQARKTISRCLKSSAPHNFLFCIEVSESPNELNRLAFFLSIIADIQRMCLQDFGLLMRGGITRGNLLFTDDVVFGRGIVDVVTIEQEARYPRIVVDASIIDTLKKWHAQVKDIMAGDFTYIIVFCSDDKTSLLKALDNIYIPTPIICYETDIFETDTHSGGGFLFDLLLGFSGHRPNG